jgi:hypothetical protein
MNKNLKQKQILTLETRDEIYSPRLGIVYREIEKNYSYELVLASTELDLISDADMIIPTSHTNLEYSITAHANMIFPVLDDALFLKNHIGEIDDFALEQIKNLRKESKQLVEIRFEVGNEIIFHSDRRYSIMLHNLSIVNDLGTEAMEVIFSGTPDNLVALLTLNDSESSNILDSLYSNFEQPEYRDLLTRQLLMAHDKGAKLEELLIQKDNENIQTIHLNLDLMESVLVA